MLDDDQVIYSTYSGLPTFLTGFHKMNEISLNGHKTQCKKKKEKGMSRKNEQLQKSNKTYYQMLGNEETKGWKYAIAALFTMDKRCQLIEANLYIRLIRTCSCTTCLWWDLYCSTMFQVNKEAMVKHQKEEEVVVDTDHTSAVSFHWISSENILWWWMDFDQCMSLLSSDILFLVT